MSTPSGPRPWISRLRLRAEIIVAASLVLVLAAGAVAWAQSQSCVQPPPNLASWWPGDGNANDIQDGNNGTLQNGATFAPGLVAQAFSFDGRVARTISPKTILGGRVPGQ